MTNYFSYRDNKYKLDMIAGLNEVINARVRDGWQPNFVNFMFNHIPGGRAWQMDAMTSQVERVHRTLTRHVVRYEKSAGWKDLRPVFIGCHDLPVWKKDQPLRQSTEINAGLHYNVIALIPPAPKVGIDPKVKYAVFGKESRLREKLSSHFQSKGRFYLTEDLARIHVTEITYGSMTDYALKTFKAGGVSVDNLRIWN